MKEDYEPYGEEWVKEMKKLPKDFLIEMVKKANLRIQELENPLSSIKDRIINNGDKLI